jgi:hypothetical protein
MDFSTRLFTAKGDLSTMRVIFVGVAVLVVALPMVAWSLVYVFHNEAADIPSGVVTLASLVFLTVTGGKYLEKREEVKANVAQTDCVRSGGGSNSGPVPGLTGQEN